MSSLIKYTYFLVIYFYLKCIEIADAVVSSARATILDALEYVERVYKLPVVYGDTGFL
jgi:DNA polymerase elongation subunit (family B)